MNEKDIIHNIENKTKDLPIPDSISPETMKKMLDAHINDVQANDTVDHSKRNRYIRRFTVAACLVLCLTGVLSVSGILSKTEDSQPNGTDYFTSDETVESEENAAEEAASTDEFDEELAYQSGLSSPSSYEEYYNTLKSAYDDYYDRIASVQTNEKQDAVYENGIMGVEISDDRATGAAEAATDSIASDYAADMGATSEAKLKSDKDYSSTNTQEKAVDEGDIIKTDGTYIYKVSHSFNNDTGDYESRLTITETDNGNMNNLASINLDNVLKKTDNDYVDFQEFYLYDDQLVFLYTKVTYSDSADNYNQTKTYIVIYDLKDKENPKEVQCLSQSGWYVSSRISDGYLYTISNFNDTSLVSVKPYSNYVPIINGKTIECSNIYYPSDVLMETTYVMTSLELSDPNEFADSKAVPTKGGQTYVSDSSIYIYSTVYDTVNKTEITKISYDQGKLTPGNSATVAGYLYDSFALSEYDGYLRIVSTIPANNISLLRNSAEIDSKEDLAFSDDIDVNIDINALYVLDSNMELVGKLSGLAPGEQIYSARFMGTIGYFVTYRNTDPLFSVDLSDPANPKILGKLKIPGFSNYLHFYDDNLLLGIGEEIDENTQNFKGLKLSMFNISDPSDVTEEDKYILENSQGSDALYNHKAIMIDPAKNLFGFLYWGYDSNYDNFYYYVTYTYDKEKGFIETAKYQIDDDSGYETNGVRGVYIGNYLYLATNKSITSYQLGSTDPIAKIYFNNTQSN